MDANVTRGNLKNLVTDKPAPITVALAQKSDSDGLFKLMDANVTRGNLKNLVTDKPAPITVALAQKKNSYDFDHDIAQMQKYSSTDALNLPEVHNIPTKEESAKAAAVEKKAG